MTVEPFVPIAVKAILGVGPYAFTQRVDDPAELSVQVIMDGQVVVLSATDVTVTINADQDDVPGGNVTLSASAAVTYAGEALHLIRQTIPQQGWRATQGGRERSLETQLDRLTRGQQDLFALFGRGILHGGGARHLSLPAPSANRTLFARDDGAGWENGPTLDEIVQIARTGIADGDPDGTTLLQIEALVADLGLGTFDPKTTYETARDAQ